MTEVVNVVTSCSLDGWNKYGRKFFETYQQFWPKSFRLHIVSEDLLPINSGENWHVYSLRGSNLWCEFNAAWGKFKWAQGDSTVDRPADIAPRWPRNTGYSFKFDAYKFSKKIFAIERIAGQVKTGKLLWVDADTLTHTAIPEGLPDKVLPPNHALSCLSRVGYHSECGFVGYNLDHPQTMPFLRELTDVYVSGRVFGLAEWHDSWVFDWLRSKMMVATHDIPHKSKGHPFINSELGLYMDHLKGARKIQGRTNKHEQASNLGATVPYWR
jgi:hypothetical protein